MDEGKLTDETAAQAAVKEVAANGEGYDTTFLPGGHVIDVPAASDEVSGDYAPTKAGEPVRHYAHFSLAMSASRRFCRWVAWNIDGTALRKNDREGIPFVLDEAYEEKFQVGDDLYAHNALDRGHIARRADLVWGDAEEAEQANRDSFFFTNITPQAEDFNQSGKHGLWGELENAIFAGTKVEKLRLSLFGGPLFRETDLAFKGVLVPRSYWKVIGYVEDGALKAKAYALTQEDLESKLPTLGLEQFKLYQLSLPELSEMTGLDFGPLTAADTMEAKAKTLMASGEPAVRRIESRAELVE